MASDVAQWLIEIRTLQRQLAETCSERDAAFKSAANWRKLYDTEARQRRIETQQLQGSIHQLQQSLAALGQDTSSHSSHQQTDSASTHDLQQLKSELAELTPEMLRERLLETLLRCDRLAQALQAERAEHAQTRKNLTMALGDTIDMIARHPDHNLVETRVDSSASRSDGIS